jgi:hypothetical protein
MLKNSESINHFLQNHIETVVAKLGTGIILPVAYDTAWLARVPAFPDTQQPAFPKALEWLRQQQLPDGSWGTAAPCNAHGNTLSTLAALLALAHWHHPQDKQRIEHGINSLKKLAVLLNTESHETIGFELLLPTLVSECTLRGIMLSAELLQYYQPYESMSAEKRKLISKLREKYGDSHPVSWWFSLEMLGGVAMMAPEQELGLQETMLAANGSVASSPAATAYLLAATRYRGKDVPRAYAYLQAIDQQNGDKGAMPNVAPIDGFELSFGVNYLIEAGVSPQTPYLQAPIQQLYKIWQQYDEGGVGYSSYFIIDPDESANGMRVLLAAGYKDIKPKVLTDYFNGTYIENFKGERSPSVSANLHVISALRMLPPTSEIEQVIKSIVSWLNTIAQNEGAIFADKWHFSAVYPVARAVIALEGIDNQLAQRCVNYLIQSQRPDGGWGHHDFSTAEETAFASLALVHWYKQQHKLDKAVLAKAQAYLYDAELFPELPLWIGKVLYCPYWVVASLIAAGLYALTQALNTDIYNL